LFPIDEWGGEFISATPLVQNRYFDVDSVLFQKYRLRSFVRDAAVSDNVLGVAQSIAPGSMILQANANQRLWFFERGAFFELTNTARAQKIQRYHSMRGFN
jgi:hypothetical protein